MAELTNPDKNIFFRLELWRNAFLSLDHTRPSSESWIPFSLSLAIGGQERHAYPESTGATLSLFETRNLIELLECIVQRKSDGQTIETFDFYSSEGFFELIVYDNFEPDSVSVAIWINMGTLSEGQSYGYDQGYRFDVELHEMRKFIVGLRYQLQDIVGST